VCLAFGYPGRTEFLIEEKKTFFQIFIEKRRLYRTVYDTFKISNEVKMRKLKQV